MTNFKYFDIINIYLTKDLYMSTLTINRSTIILAMKNIESIIKNVLTNLLFTNEEIETVIKNNKILNGLKEDNDIYIDFIITVPYHDKKIYLI